MLAAGFANLALAEHTVFMNNLKENLNEKCGQTEYSLWLWFKYVDFAQYPTYATNPS